jgi:predicted  nucleic acid-binding Zn-ribbon protein
MTTSNQTVEVKALQDRINELLSQGMALAFERNQAVKDLKAARAELEQLREVVSRVEEALSSLRPEGCCL